MFEFDPAKSAANKAKHGIDFDEAQTLWSDADGYVVPLRSATEPRWALIARLGETYWCAIHTIRPLNIRIISVRRARKKEIVGYEQAQEHFGGRA